MTYDQFLGALCLWREARGASMSAKAAIWQVILNRVADKRWPNTIHDVVTQPLQFSSFNATDVNVTAWPTERHPLDWQAWLDCQSVVALTIGGDPTNGATNYESLPDTVKKPSWCDPAKITATIGPFRFYKL